MSGESGSVRIEGLTQVVRALQAIGVEVDDLKDAFSDIAEEGAQVAAFLAPKLTGTLATNVRGNRAKSKAVVTAGGASVPYAGPINYGWARRGITASGFMQRTDAFMAPYGVKRLEQNLSQIIRQKGLA